MLKQLTRVLLLIFLFSTSLLAQDGLPVSAYVTHEGLVIASSQQQVVHGNITQFRHLKWRDDGRYLLFHNGNNLNLYNASTHQITLLNAHSTIFPADFINDQAVIYAANPQPITSQNGPAMTATIYSHAIDGEAQALGSIEFLVGCAGTFPFPMDAIYNNETGFGGRSLIFAYSDYGLIYSTSCDGVGMGLFNFDTQQTERLGSHLTRATLSPDRTRLATFDEASGALQVIHLADRSIQNVPISHAPDQITWNQDGTALFYSARHFISDPLPISAEEEATLISKLGLSRDSIPQYQASVHRVDLQGNETLLFHEPAWAIGSLNSHARGVYFNVIFNGESWVEALTQGAVDPFAQDSFMQAWHSVQVSTLLVPEHGGNVSLLIDDAYQVALRP
jgi:hypothetical protein